jgi:Na+-driven multidrug efflux pump
MNTGIREMILKDSLWKLMIKLSLPGIAGMLVMALNSLVDALYVGRFVGSAALAGVSMVIPLMVLNTALLNLIVAGSASLLSRSIGSEDKDSQQRIFAHVLVLSVVVTAILMLLGIFLAKPLIATTGAKGEP